MTPREPLRPAGQVPPRTGVRLRGLPLPVLLGILLVGGLCALLALNTASAAQELKQRALTDRNAEISDAEQQLMRDLAAKQAPASLAAAAIAQGLVPNPNPAFLRLNADGSVTVLGSPTPASVPPRPVSPKPTPSASASSTKPAPSSSATPSSSASPGSSAKPTPGVTSSTGNRPASRSGVTAPVVTVTVTKPAPAPSSTPSTRPSTTKSKASGGH